MIERKYHNLFVVAYSFLGDYMKFVTNILKKICLGIFGIYSINILFSLINIVIPINVYTILLSSMLGVSGITAIIVLKLII